MMRRAGRVHTKQTLVLVVLIGIWTWIGAEVYGTLRASWLVDLLKTANTADVRPIIGQLSGYRRWAAKPIDRLMATSEVASEHHLRAGLASLALWPGGGPRLVELEDRLLTSTFEDLPVIWGVLRENGQGTEERLRQVLERGGGPERRFRAGCALANAVETLSDRQWDTMASYMAGRFLATVVADPGEYARLVKILRPIRARLVGPLGAIFRDPSRPESDRNFATNLLADYAGDNPDALAGLLMDAEPKAYQIFLAGRASAGIEDRPHSSARSLRRSRRRPPWTRSRIGWPVGRPERRSS